MCIFVATYVKCQHALENLGYFNAENIGGYEMLKAAGFEVIEP